MAGLLATPLARAQDITGAGASFPAPVYAKWADAYRQSSGVRVNYQSIGSSAGVKQIRARTVDFGASDASRSEEQLSPDGLMQFPTLIGGIVPVVSVKGIEPGQLKLTGEVLGDIYLGKVKRWNDPAITALNPGLALPDAAIAVVRRADGSGTTFLFTNYLSKVNAEWRARVGEGTAVKWITGAGGKGNEGVSTFVKRLPNAIGYVEYAYAKQIRLPHVQLRNRDGRYVQPDAASFQAAAASADWRRSFHHVLTDQPGPSSWPITGATFVLMHKTQDQPAKSTQVLRFFDWAFRQGDAMAVSLGYVTLPDPLKAMVRRRWAEQLRDSAGQPVPLP